MAFAFGNPILLSANNGIDECPSCETELASNTEKGITPDANNITKIKCGPDSGIMPIRTANKIIHGILELIRDSISK